MNVLLVSPATPTTFWSLKHAMRFVARRAAFPPLGLLTVAAMLPRSWNLRLVDMDVTRLTDADILWADYVLVSAMIVHKASVEADVIPRCRRLGRPIVGGGPLFTTGHEEFAGDVHAVLGECEESIGELVRDMEAGQLQRHVSSAVGVPRREANAGAALGFGQSAALRDDVGPVFARLPVRLRVLRHHGHERPQAADEDARSRCSRSSMRWWTRAGRGRCFSSTTISSATSGA